MLVRESMWGASLLSLLPFFAIKKHPPSLMHTCPHAHAYTHTHSHSHSPTSKEGEGGEAIAKLKQGRRITKQLKACVYFNYALSLLFLLILSMIMLNFSIKLLFFS